MSCLWPAAAVTAGTQGRTAIISLAEALKDKACTQPDHYYKPWGISRLYRWGWLRQAQRIKELMRSGRDDDGISSMSSGQLKSKKL